MQRFVISHRKNYQSTARGTSESFFDDLQITHLKSGPKSTHFYHEVIINNYYFIYNASKNHSAKSRPYKGISWRFAELLLFLTRNDMEKKGATREIDFEPKFRAKIGKFQVKIGNFK